MVSGLEIVGQHEEADGIRIEGVMRPTITGVLLRKLRHGIHVTGRARNVLMEDCSQMVIGNNCFGHNADYGVERELCTGVTLRNCRDIILSSSQILDSAPYGIRLDNSSDITMTAMTVQDRRNPPLQKSAVYWTGSPGQSIVTACRFAGYPERPFVAEPVPVYSACLPSQNG